jgi:hypothetical protein
MTDINPASAEELRPLLLKAFRISERAPIHAEQARFLIIDNVSFLHDESPRKTPSASPVASALDRLAR